jgi:multiple sugar transport system permease protein
VRRPAVNDSVPSDAVVDLGELGVRANDVIAVVGGGEVFRGRIAEVMDGTRLRIDMSFEQLPSLKRLPGTVTGGSCEVKVFDQESYVPRLTRYDTATGQLSTLGFAPLFGNSFLCMFAWLNGAEFMNEDGTEVLLDSEPIVEALQFISDIYDAQGGIQNVNAFQTTVASGALDPWISGAIAMRFDLGGLIDAVSIFKPDLAFGAAGAPIPRERLEAGHTSVGWMGGWAYAIPSTAKYKEAAWDLMRWFCSVEANQLMYRFQASQAKARGWGFFPPHHPDYRVMEWLEQEFIAGNPAITDYMRDAFHVFVDLLPTSRYRPVTPVGQRLWSEHIRATDAAISHTKNPYDALNYGKRRVQVDLDRIQTPPSGPLVPWKKIIVIYSIAIVAVFVGLVLYQERKRIKAGGVYREWIPGYVCASPWIVGFVTLGCGPIIFSMIISFSHYDVLNPARFIGFTNYVNLMGFHGDPVVNESVPNDPLFWRSLANTAFMIIGVPLGIVAGLALAMLLNAKVKGLQIFRTIYYLPAIVPAVASFVLWIWIFDPVRGFLNQILRILGVSDPPHWLQDPVWAKPALIIMGLWGVGAGMIIWLAGLKEIPESLYEAARIDGASRVQQFRHVTLPLLTPYIFFNFIMGMIGVFQVFEAAYIMTSGGPADATLFYAYKLFNEAFRYLNMGTASAMAWIMFVVILAITLFQLWFSKKWVHYER